MQNFLPTSSCSEESCEKKLTRGFTNDSFLVFLIFASRLSAKKRQDSLRFTCSRAASDAALSPVDSDLAYSSCDSSRDTIACPSRSMAA
jgi:hypothetical protein